MLTYLIMEFIQSPVNIYSVSELPRDVIDRLNTEEIEVFKIELEAGEQVVYNLIIDHNSAGASSDIQWRRVAHHG